MSDVPAFPVYVDGRLHPAGTPVIAAEDQGFLLGLAVFETLLVEEGTTSFLDDHLARLRRGAAGLGIPWPPPWDPRDALATFLVALEAPRAAVRLTLSRGVPGRGASLVITARPVDPIPKPGVRVLVSSLRKLGHDPLENLKATSRLRHVLAREEARGAGAWEALLLNDADELAEATVSNIFLVADDVLRTPAIESGCLGGIVRDRILADLEREPVRDARGRPLSVEVGRVGRDTLARAGEVFLTNTTGGVVPVVEVFGGEHPPVTLPGEDGPVTRQIAARLALLQAGDRGAVRNPTAGGG